MAESTIVKTKRDGILTLYDDARGNSYAISYEQGDFSLTIPGRTINVFLDRGVLGATPSVRWGDDQPMSGSFTAYMRDANDAAAAILFNLATETGWANSNWTSTLGSNAEVFTVEMELTIEGTDHGDAADHTITIDHCALSVQFAEGDPNLLTINFVSYDLYPTVA
jgi:hypothetical protein